MLFFNRFLLSLFCLFVIFCDKGYSVTQDTQKPVLVFIHGISAGFSDWDSQINEISSTNFTMRFSDSDTIVNSPLSKETPSQWIWNISYYSHNVIEETLRGDLELYANRVDMMLDKISELSKHDRFIIIAHSMGGLIARKMMTLSQESWDRVEKILTIGTPHVGVETAFGIVGQLKDLSQKSDFIQTLNKAWRRFPDSSQKWGVIGAMNISPYLTKKSYRYVTDSGGIGFVTISSAIPFGEWEQAIKEMNHPTLNTDNFGFRLATYGTHKGLLLHPATQQGIEWLRRE